ncbi:MAG: hypothetical protein M3468_13310, partial [Acidobacteriota bacterium]|nr:hypothetical protein [Acidobacteriota bacterium]
PLHEHGEIVDLRLQLLTELDFVFEPAATLHDFLGPVLVLPEIGRADPCSYPGEFVFRAGGVKDNSAGLSRGARGLRICGAARRVEGTWKTILCATCKEILLDAAAQ